MKKGKKDTGILYEKAFLAIFKMRSEHEALNAVKAYVDLAVHGQNYTGNNETIDCILEQVKSDLEAARENYEKKANRARDLSAKKKAENNNKWAPNPNKFMNFTQPEVDYQAIAEERVKETMPLDDRPPDEKPK